MENAIREIFGEKVEYFIPIHHQEIGSYKSTNVLVPGYAFVKDCDHVRNSLDNIRDSRIFSKALGSKSKIQTISSTNIAALKRRLKYTLKKKFILGSKVRICGGPLKNLTGEIVSIEDRGLNVVVKVTRISREILAPIPATLVEILCQ
jgi:transcription antitermination factor NusG